MEETSKHFHAHYRWHQWHTDGINGIFFPRPVRAPWKSQPRNNSYTFNSTAGMTPEMVVTQQPRQQEEAETTITSEGLKMNVASSSSNEGVDTTVSSAEERCEAETTITNVDNNDINDPSSVDTILDENVVSNEQMSLVDQSGTTLIAQTNQADDDTPEDEAEQRIIPICNQNAAQHVELDNTINNEADAAGNSQSYVQYQRQEQSISSNSLVQLEDDQSILLQQPLLNDDKDELNVSAAKVCTSSPGDKNHEVEKVQNQQHVNIVDANEGSEHGPIDEKKIDDGSLLLEKDQVEAVSCHEETQSSSSEKSDYINEHDTTGKSTAQLLFPNRATMSMSPSLLRNNNREEGFTPSPPVPAQLQPQQYQSPPNNYDHQGNNSTMNNTIISSPSRITYASPPGRRTIRLRLLEEIPSSLPPPKPRSLTPSSSSTLKAPFKRIRSLTLSGGLSFPYLNEDKSTPRSTTSHNTTTTTATPTIQQHDNGNFHNHTMLTMDRGIITVSWYDGTTSSEMQEHVFGCVLRKLNKSSGGNVKLEDVRLLDENVEPHEGKSVFVE